MGAFLEGEGIDPRYEAEKIEYEVPARRAKYTPDFPIYTRGTGKKVIIETKGQFKAADRKKHLLIKQQHPDIDLRFVFTNPNQRLSKQSKTTYAKWCEDHGFLFAKGLPPIEWLDE